MIKNAKFCQFCQKCYKPLILIATILFHIGAFCLFKGKAEKEFKEEDFIETKVFKLVDVQEYLPPPPKPKSTPKKEVEVAKQKEPKASEKVEEKKEEEIAEEQKEEAEPEPFKEYVPQHKISKAPAFPAKKVLSRLSYPQMAKKQGIEGVVVLELFIDPKGKVVKINVLKDPGYGFAEAAVAAFNGIDCVPALINGKPCAVRYRYPVRFKLT